ncbi:MAG: hypothetical protein VB022_03510 [Rikenellaceae bacterium]|nr:hypothetical protein [Rikenellaceae bacterium]
MRKWVIYPVTIIIAFMLYVSSDLYGMTRQDSTDNHEFIIYVIPSTQYIDWQSPSTLYKSTTKSWIKSKFSKCSYYIGHLFIELRSSLVDEPILMSVRSTGDKEKKRLLFKERVGIGIIGAALPGRIETKEELTVSIDHYLKKARRIAFIKYSINRDAAHRIIQYLEGFMTKDSTSYAACDAYGGAFWPRYKGEGAGCSAFGMVALEVAGIKYDYEDWLHRVNIPANLVGGEFNNNIKIKNRDIKRQKAWDDGHGIMNVDFFPFFIYDPSLIYNWIIEQRDKYLNDSILSDRQFYPAVIKKDRGDIPGLCIDARNVTAPVYEPIFIKRTDYSVFIDRFTRSHHHK